MLQSAGKMTMQKAANVMAKATGASVAIMAEFLEEIINIITTLKQAAMALVCFPKQS